MGSIEDIINTTLKSSEIALDEIQETGLGQEWFSEPDYEHYSCQDYPPTRMVWHPQQTRLEV